MKFYSSWMLFFILLLIRTDGIIVKYECRGWFSTVAFMNYVNQLWNGNFDFLLSSLDEGLIFEIWFQPENCIKYLSFPRKRTKKNEEKIQ